MPSPGQILSCLWSAEPLCAGLSQSQAKQHSSHEEHDSEDTENDDDNDIEYVTSVT